MSKRGKNRHYHYAEKFEPRDRHQRGRFTVFHLPVKAVIISLIVLMMFGLISTTFATYVTENQPDPAQDGGSVMVSVRNFKAMRDSSYSSGANAMNMDLAESGGDMDLAESGGNVTGGTVVVEVPSSWTSYSNIQFVLYQNGYSWCSADMTRIANTNFYYASNPNHGSWSNEQICFIANNNHWGEGSFDPATGGCAKYSGKVTQAMSSNYYTFWLSGSSNAYTNTYKGNYDSLANAIYVYNQTANIYTSTTGSAASNYSSSGAGGNVTITARYLDTSNNSATESTTPSSNGATSVTYERAVYHTAVTYNATANTGYRFVGWYTSTTATNAASTDATYQLTSSLTGTNTLYARFIKRVTVSITKSPSAYTGTAPTLTGGGSTGASITVDVGTSVTLNSNCSSPVNCTFKTGSASGTEITSPYTVTSATSIYACYTLSAPKNLSITYDTTVEGAAAITPTKSASRYAGSSGTLSYSYSYISGGTGPSDGYSLNASTGAFSATVAGTYNIRMTVTHTQSGLSASSTKDTTVTVKPAPVTRVVTDGHNFNSGEGTYAQPWKVPVNSTTFNINSYIPEEDQDSDYTFKWTRTDGTYVISSGTITDGSHTVTTDDTYTVTDIATSGTAQSDVIHNSTLSDTLGYIYKVAVTKTRNGVESDAFYVTSYYGVTTEFLVVNSFDFSQFNDTSGEEIQKIYAEDNGIDYIKAVYEAGGNTFHTILVFSKDNLTYDEVAVWTPATFTISSGHAPFSGSYSALPNDSSHQVATLQEEMDTVARNDVNLMTTTGPKWFKAYVDDYGHPNLGAQYPELHTTVGTSEGVSNRPIYFVDSTGVTQTNSRIMAFYVVESDGDVHYQTGQTVAGRSNTYRFYVPSDAFNISFAYVATNNYLIPSYSSGSFSYTLYTDSTVLKAWTSTIDLTDDANVGMTAFVADTPGTPTGGIYNYTNTANEGNMTTLT